MHYDTCALVDADIDDERLRKRLVFATPLNGLDGFIKQELKYSMPRFDEYDDSSVRNHCDEAANTGRADDAPSSRSSASMSSSS